MDTNTPGQLLPEMPSQPPKHEEKPTADSEADDVATAEDERRRLQPKKKAWGIRRKPAQESGLQAEQSTSGGAENPGHRPPRRGRRRTLFAVMAVALLGGAVYLGSTLPDPKNSQEYKSLQADGARLESELNKVKTDYKTLDDGMKAREIRVTAFGQELTKREETVKAAEAAVKKREDAVTVAEKQKAANTVREGTWTVGVDIEPGTYRTDAEVSSSCYWGIYRTGSNGADIIDNDIVSGGRPTVTVSPGQDFKTTRCGAWTRQ
ncbi:hypothetical protein DM794_03135 [Paenarthrobacter ureafaciens]|uniref:hypothetical protein n=1 Tax=Paenarthrobacter ureafaciens TaxID=37931 RepID=UPI0015B86F4D|nr:hypothetical protein [Paenarthrobacter ureafaciens]NWL26060.1 hypothetical protein [Paenarthrobacter ureafaciens]